MTAEPSISSIRRRNVLALYQQFASERLAGNPHAQGLEREFAATLEVSPSTWSMMKGGPSGARPIGDKLARQIEQHAGRPQGWLDQMHEELQLPDEAEERFLAEARRLWRAANAKGKRELQRAIRQAAQPPARS